MKDIKDLLFESKEYYFDVLGENMKLPEDVIFYYEDGIKDKMDNDNTKLHVFIEVFCKNGIIKNLLEQLKH